jgi:hypothetical protein
MDDDMLFDVSLNTIEVKLMRCFMGLYPVFSRFRARVISTDKALKEFDEGNSSNLLDDSRA